MIDIDPKDPRQFPKLPKGLNGSPTPWVAHPNVGLNGNRGWHVAMADARRGHDHGACIAICGRRDDAEVIAELVTKFAIRDASPLGRVYEVTQAPWFVREEPDDDGIMGWHVYGEADGEHQCIATFHRELDAKLTLIVVNGVAMLERAARRG